MRCFCGNNTYELDSLDKQACRSLAHIFLQLNRKWEIPYQPIKGISARFCNLVFEHK